MNCCDSLEGSALVKVLNNCLSKDKQVVDIVFYDGSYKHVSSHLSDPFKGTHTVKKQKKKTKNLQMLSLVFGVDLVY